MNALKQSIGGSISYSISPILWIEAGELGGKTVRRNATAREVEAYEARIVNEIGSDRNATRQRDNRWMSGDENEVQEITTVRSGDE
jgi:hypothetical protein